MQNEKVIRNVSDLVSAAAIMLQVRGMTEAQIIAELPRLASEAVAFLANKRRELQ